MQLSVRSRVQINECFTFLFLTMNICLHCAYFDVDSSCAEHWCYREIDLGLGWSAASRLAASEGDQAAWLIFTGCGMFEACDLGGGARHAVHTGWVRIWTSRRQASVQRCTIITTAEGRYKVVHREGNSDIFAAMYHDDSEDKTPDRFRNCSSCEATHHSVLREMDERGLVRVKTNSMIDKSKPDACRAASNMFTTLEASGQTLHLLPRIRGGAAIPTRQGQLTNGQLGTNTIRKRCDNCFVRRSYGRTFVPSQEEGQAFNTHSIPHCRYDYHRRSHGACRQAECDKWKSSTLCIQHRGTNWRTCWMKVTSRFHSSGSKVDHTWPPCANAVLSIVVIQNSVRDFEKELRQFMLVTGLMGIRSFVFGTLFKNMERNLDTKAKCNSQLLGHWHGSPVSVDQQWSNFVNKLEFRVPAAKLDDLKFANKLL